MKHRIVPRLARNENSQFRKKTNAFKFLNKQIFISNYQKINEFAFASFFDSTKVTGINKFDPNNDASNICESERIFLN